MNQDHKGQHAGQDKDKNPVPNEQDKPKKEEGRGM